MTLDTEVPRIQFTNITVNNKVFPGQKECHNDCQKLCGEEPYVKQSFNFLVVHTKWPTILS